MAPYVPTHGQCQGVGAQGEGEAMVAPDLKELTSSMGWWPRLPSCFLPVPLEVAGESGQADHSPGKVPVGRDVGRPQTRREVV